VKTRQGYLENAAKAGWAASNEKIAVMKLISLKWHNASVGACYIRKWMQLTNEYACICGRECRLLLTGKVSNDTVVEVVDCSLDSVNTQLIIYEYSASNLNRSHEASVKTLSKLLTVCSKSFHREPHTLGRKLVYIAQYQQLRP